ncbi:HicB_like antitoxin of toxin-antitoxin system [Methanolobus vulcani]|jgi:predicted RNase H-like HicB family nuclease|uniref:HicB_like antitoxin of toxin-antitoxin system n=1 Tax=Methanolobus vulcani TaxID=38026 RepID=A0A7Z7AUV5_9EURY|nr:type II toxin-antitoxin system HicB family antitoxin [Methanolobus vulcani]SDF44648.1 HicB_like antitoxin of toxin-antitoxin system [Methanolobus vulcani]
MDVIVANYIVEIEQDEDGIYVASVPELPGCHTQAETLDELNQRIKEAIELYNDVKYI